VGSVPPDRFVRGRVRPLFDVGPLRSLRRATLGRLGVDVTTIVLGSTQDEGDLNCSAIEGDGAEVRRRRGGGGAVLLRPGDCWAELWLPRGVGVRDDVRATAYRVGGWWHQALRELGVETELHRGAVRDPEQGARACFAGLGPGELSIAGEKLLGLSQWRSREGALVSSVVSRAAPSGVARYLQLDVALPRLRSSTSFGALGEGVDSDSLTHAFSLIASADLGVLEDSRAPFA
jgi:lipoate-protein ligase A